MVQEKLDKLQAYCTEFDCDWLLVANFGHELHDSILYYIFLKHPEHAALLIPKAGKPVLFITPFEVSEMASTFPEIVVRPFNDKFVSVVSRTIKLEEKIAVRTAVLPYQAHMALTQAGYMLVPATDLEKVIATKTKDEIQAMRDVASLTDTCFAHLMEMMPQFQTEAEAAQFVTGWAFGKGMEVSFPTIIASGAHAAHPHYTTAPLPLQRGFCVIDMGLRRHGYCSDMTRTIFFGEPTDEERKLYDRLRMIQEKTITLVAPGVAIAGPDIFCRAELKELNNLFIHGLGHGVGTQVHEWPGVSGKNTDLLEPGMIITIEPGIYQENSFGIRIEDDVLVTDTGNEVLTKTPKDLLCIPLNNTRPA